MPIVERQIKQEVETTFGVVKVPHQLYVAPDDLEAGDKIIPNDQLSPDQLRELAEQYPEEFGADAKDAGIVGISPAAFLKLTTPKAIEAVAAEADEAKLILWYGAEAERKPQRPKVLAAFGAKGIPE